MARCSSSEDELCGLGCRRQDASASQCSRRSKLCVRVVADQDSDGSGKSAGDEFGGVPIAERTARVEHGKEKRTSPGERWLTKKPYPKMASARDGCIWWRAEIRRQRNPRDKRLRDEVAAGVNAVMKVAKLAELAISVAVNVVVVAASLIACPAVCDAPR